VSARAALVAQFRQPSGVIGTFAGWMMANRPSNVRRNAWTVSLLDLQPNARVLEWGCGPGIGIEACLRAAPDATVLAVDHSPLMVAHARRRNRRAVEQERARIVVGKLDAAVSSAPFDAIFSCNVLQFADNEREALTIMRNMLAPGGVVANTFQPRAPGAGAPEALAWGERVAAQCAAAGFSGVRINKLDLKPAPAACVLARRPGA